MSPPAKPLETHTLPSEALTLGEPAIVAKSRISLFVFLTLAILSAVTIFLFSQVFNSSDSLSIRCTMLVFGLICAGVTVYRLYPYIVNFNSQVAVLKDGLSFTQNGRTRTMRWTEVSDVWQNQEKYIVLIPIVDIHEYTVVGKDGSRFKIGNTFPRIGEIGAAIYEKVEQAKRSQSQ